MKIIQRRLSFSFKFNRETFLELDDELSKIDKKFSSFSCAQIVFFSLSSLSLSYQFFKLETDFIENLTLVWCIALSPCLPNLFST